jgi:hypothetical protein
MEGTIMPGESQSVALPEEEAREGVPLEPRLLSPAEERALDAMTKAFSINRDLALQFKTTGFVGVTICSIRKPRFLAAPIETQKGDVVVGLGLDLGPDAPPIGPVVVFV